MDNKEFESAKKAVIGAVIDLLKYKNEKYGNSALEPANIFYKGDAITSINIRLDDKIKRVINSGELRKNDVCDIVGYLFLALVSLEQRKEDNTQPGEGGRDKSFQGMLKDVANVVYTAVTNDTETTEIFSKEPAYLRNADETIKGIKNGNLVNHDSYIGLITPLINLMVDSGWTDLSEFKD